MKGNAVYMLKSLVRRGPRFLWLYFRESLLFDLVNRTNTHLRVPKPEDDDGGSAERRDGLLYVASLTSVVRNTLRVATGFLGRERFADAQFLDLGCGKAKTLLVYAKEFADPGGPVAVGIEYDRALCEVAWRNIARVRKARDRVEVHCDSAVNLDAYIGESTLVVYLYNSFQGETLRAVLDRLARRPHVLIYVDPVERNILPSLGYEVIAENDGRYNADTWVVAART